MKNTIPWIFLIFSSCQPDIIGHWHLIPINEEANNCSFYTIDFYESEHPIMNSNQRGFGNGGMRGYPNSNKHLIKFGPSCFSFFVNYYWEEGKLYFEEEKFDGQGGKWLATKQNLNYCNLEKEFFNGMNFHLSFAQISDTLKLNKFDNLENLSLLQHLFFAKEKTQIDSTPIVLNSGYKKLTIDDLDMYCEMFEIKTPENSRHLINLLIYADKDTPMNIIAPVLKYYKEETDYEKLHFVLLEDQPNFTTWVKTFNFTAINIQKIDTMKTFSKWINQ